MAKIHDLIQMVSEGEINRKLGQNHDKARMLYRQETNTIRDTEEFEVMIGDYYNHHQHIVENASPLPLRQASHTAKGILDQEYRRDGGDWFSAYTDCRDGFHGGLHTVLNRIAEGLKYRDVQSYIEDCFNKYAPRDDFEAKVELIRQFFQYYGHHLPLEMQSDRPERYAVNFQDLIYAYVNGLRQTASQLRRL